MARDPAVLAVFAVHLTRDDLAAVLGGRPIFQRTWPPVRCQGVVVGLHVDDAVIGEALLVLACSAPAGAPDRVEWRFTNPTRYRFPLPHTRTRGMASPMPHVPLGTLTEPRADAWAE